MSETNTRSSTHEVRYQEQVEEYQFPYHYIPHERDGAWFLHRHLGWGMEYLAVLTTVRDRVLSLEPSTALDVGTGDARLPFELASHDSELQVTGVDPVAQAAAYARAFCHRFGERVRIVEGLIEDLDQSEFDVATAMEVFEHIPDSILGDFVASIWKRLSQEGRLVISVPTIVRPVHPKHERHYTAELLADQLRPWFEIESVEYVYRDCFLQRVIDRFLLNRLGLSTLGPLVRFLRRCHDRRVVPATRRDGTHLIAICKPCHS